MKLDIYTIVTQAYHILRCSSWKLSSKARIAWAFIIVVRIQQVEFGVPQGSILGPVLFTIYVNDLLSVPKRCLSASYVDDCKLYLSFSTAELPTSILALNEDLTRISQWCCKNSLLIKPDKTKVLAVGLPQLLKKLSSFSITLFDKEITPVPVVKDLGVLLDTRLSYNISLRLPRNAFLNCTKLTESSISWIGKRFC